MLSTIIYLDSSGGPTLILDQRPTDSIDSLSSAWLVQPKPNRLACFPGDLLHGVLPGRACSSLFLQSSLVHCGTSQLRTGQTVLAQPLFAPGSLHARSAGPSGEQGDNHRITLIVSFWSRQRQPMPNSSLGPCMNSPIGGLGDADFSSHSFHGKPLQLQRLHARRPAWQWLTQSSRHLPDTQLTCPLPPLNFFLRTPEDITRTYVPAPEAR